MTTRQVSATAESPQVPDTSEVLSPEVPQPLKPQDVTVEAKHPHLKIKQLLGEELAGYGWVATPKALVRNWRLLKGLNASDVLLLILLLDYRSSDGTYKTASVRALASQMDMGERALRKKLKKLKELNYVIQSEEVGCKRTYDLAPLFPKLVEAQKRYLRSREEKS